VASSEKDQQGVEDELAGRRKAEAEAEQARLDAEDAGVGATIDEHAAAAGVGEEDDGQLFVWEQGRKVTLGTLVGRGTAVEHAFVFSGKRMKGSGGLVALDDDVLMVARGRVSKTSIVPTRDDDEKVTKVVVEVHIAPRALVPADSDEAMGLLAGVLDKRQAA
jgi:hypothetical protein